MPRIARVVVPGLPHHVTQRGNRRQPTFFQEADYQAYLRLAAEWCTKSRVRIWSYCLMPNHVHLIAVPETRDGLREAMSEMHRRYTQCVNAREGWTGHLWQGRFASFPMDNAHFLRAAHYVEMNPVRAGMVRRAEDYPWSSAKAHLAGRDDILVKVAPLLDLVQDWGEFLASPFEEKEEGLLELHERTGRPLGGEAFLVGLESSLGRTLRKIKPGPPPRR